jgi:hypothetical protein
MAACDGIAGIVGAEIEIITDYRREITTGIAVAEVVGAAVKVRANNRRVKAAADRIAEIIRACVGIVTERQINAIVTQTAINSTDISVRWT